MAQSECLSAILLNNFQTRIDIVLENENSTGWIKDLTNMPVFTIKEIEEHRIMSGKKGKAIMKTMDRGRKFQEERYISTDSIFTKTAKNTFSVKGTCRASMKKEFRKMNVTLNRKTGKVIKAHCTCPAGNSGYCNHVMALLFEFADYSLHQLKVVPEEVACTSKLRQWGVPSEKFKYPQPVMNTSVQKQGKSKGISCTVYDPRINSNRDNITETNHKNESVYQEQRHKNWIWSCY